MPTNLSLPSSNSKRLRLTALLLVSPLFFFGQTLTGLWTGALSNDSTTVRKEQLFEIALTEYKGKVYGYSRSEFIVDDTLYYMVKRVKGTIDGDICEVTDDEIISYNFRGRLDKGIKVTSIFRRNQNDSAWYLDGTWKTNATKKYYSVSGKVNLSEEKDLTASKIFPHLEELKLANEIAFYKDRKEGTPIIKMVKPEKIKTEYATKPSLATDDLSIATKKPSLERATTNPPTITTSVTPDDALTQTSITADPAKPEENGTDDRAPIKKPAANLPKTDTKEIAITSVDIKTAPPVRTIAENTIPVEELAILNKPTADLAKTDTKNINPNRVVIIPSSSSKTIAENKTTITPVPGNTSTNPVAIVTNKEKQTVTPVLAKTNSSITSPTQADNKIVKTFPQQDQVISRNVSNNPQQKQTDTKTVVKTNNTATPTSTKVVAGTNTQDLSLTTQPHTAVPNNAVLEKKETIKTPGNTPVSVIPEEKKPAVDIIAKAALVAGRKSEFSQIVSFKADSLELSLYDNGEIDGDTVSIFMNGEVILSKQGLKASAIKKTIYITPGNEDFTLVLFAENLGKYPPNTGLLVVHDGEDVYNLRFSSDFQKNAGIVFRRKK